MGKMRVRLMREVTNAHSYFRNLWHVYGGLAMLARSLGHQVTGSDANVYPPMSTLLENQGIDLIQGTTPANWTRSRIW